MPPALSVVVPIHNVERYLEPCLDSLAGQTFTDFEALLVDDGSTDGSAVVAKAYALRDPRFTLLQQENLGPGPARELGIAAATGEFLGFLDGDDVAMRHAYDLLIGSVRETGSDIACGDVRRFGGSGVWPSRLHTGVFDADLQATHISRYPALVRDATVWNKVWRRSFWDEAGLRFPAGLYEDLPVALGGHLLAGAVDVLASVVVHWRFREAGERSITQNSGDLTNVAAKLAALSGVRDMIADHRPGLVEDFDRRILELDVPLLLAAAEGPDGERVREMLAGLGARLHPAAADGLPALTRLQFHLLRGGRADDLRTLLRDHQDPVRYPRVRGRGRRRYGAYPLLPGVPRELYDVTGELGLTTRVDDLRWDGGTLIVEGRAYLEHLDTGAGSRIQAWAVHGRSGRRLALGVQRLPCPDATADSGQETASYDRSGFRLEIDAWRLRTGGKWAEGDWLIEVAVANRGLRRTGPLTGSRAGRASWPPAWAPEPARRVQPDYTDGGGLFLRVRKVTAEVGEAVAEDGWLRLRGWVAAPERQGILRATRFQGSGELEVPATLRASGEGRCLFTAALPLSALAADPPTPGTDIQWTLRLQTGDTGHALAPRAGLPEPAAPVPGAGEAVLTVTRHGSLTLVHRVPHVTLDAAGLTPTGHLNVTGRGTPAALALRRLRSGEQYVFPAHPAGSRYTATLDLSSLATPAGPLPLPAGDWRLLAFPAPTPPPASAADAANPKTPARPPHAVNPVPPAGPEVAAVRSGVVDPVAPAGSGVAAVRSGVVDAVASAGSGVAALWSRAADGVAAEVVAGGRGPVLVPGGAEAVEVVAERSALKVLPVQAVVGDREVTLSPGQGFTLRLRVRMDRPRGAYAARMVRERAYPAARRRDLRDAVLFTSWSGTRFGGCPRAIFEELARSSAASALELVWACADGAFAPPPGTRVVATGGPEHAELLATARYVVTDGPPPPWVTPRPDQAYIYAPPAGLLPETPDPGPWNVLLSPGPARTSTLHPNPPATSGTRAEPGVPPGPRATPAAPSGSPVAPAVASGLGAEPDVAWGLRGPAGGRGRVVEVGCPGNDVLFRVGGDAGVRRRLGIGEDRRVVLYAPAFRPHDGFGGRNWFDLRIDVERAREVLGESTVLLVRGDPRAGGQTRPDDGFFRDVSGWPDVGELLCVADVLVSDYSSVMLDFALTGRPILCFAYDLDWWQGLPGSFDLAGWAPGPVLRTSDDLLEALRHAGELGAAYAARRAELVAEYRPLDDGGAAARAVAQIWGR